MSEQTNDRLRCLGSRGLQLSTDELWHRFDPKVAQVRTLFQFSGVAEPGKVSKGEDILAREGVRSLLAVQEQEVVVVVVAAAARAPRARAMERVKRGVVKTER